LERLNAPGISEEDLFCSLSLPVGKAGRYFIGGSMKYYYAETKDDYYHAVITGDNEEEMIQALNDQLGLEEEWILTELCDLDVEKENPIILTDGW
jgi:hypothetical protein